MSGVLAIHLVGDGHYAAVDAGGGATQLLGDGFGRRSWRSNAVAVGPRGFWAGASALATRVARLSSHPVLLTEASLRAPGALLLDGPHCRLSAAACMALLLRKALEDARACGFAAERIVVAADAGGSTELSAILSECVAIHVDFVDTSACLADLVETLANAAPDAPRAVRLAALLDGSIFVSKGSPAATVGGGPVVVERESEGLCTLRLALLEAAGASRVDDWARVHLWSEWLAWMGRHDATGINAEGPFTPREIDPRFGDAAFSSTWAWRRLHRLARTAEQALRPCLDGADLVLLVEDELVLGWRRLLQALASDCGSLVVALPLDRLARQLALGHLARPTDGWSVSELIVDVRLGGAAARIAVPKGAALPFTAKLQLEGDAPFQSEFEFEVCCRSVSGADAVLRRLRFKAVVPIAERPRFVVRVHVAAGPVVRLHVNNDRSGDLLQFVESRVGHGDDWLTGPESVAALPLADT